MRILIVHEALAGGGGVETYLAAVMPALARRGHRLAFLHLNSASDDGPSTLAVPDVPRASVADDGLDAAVAKMLAWAPDVCFSHNMRSLDVEERLAAALPVVKMMHGYFGTCVSGQKSHSFPFVVPCTRAFGPACLAHYLPRHCGQLAPLRMVSEYRWASRQQALFNRYAHIVVASNHMREEYVRHGAANVTTAPLFGSEALAGVRPLPLIPTVLFAGRMTALKGGDVLIRAVRQAMRIMGGPVRLLMAGDGPRRERWRELASTRGVPVEFTGWVTGALRTKYIRDASVAALPSLWPEPFGLVGLEAAAHGVPAVAFDVGGVREWLRDGINGVLVPERGDAEALGRALARLLSSRDDLERLGAGALKAAAEMSEPAHVGVLERVFAQARGPRAAVS
jgi:glycosyltransferase involved in cell wall biosynthesis